MQYTLKFKPYVDFDEESYIEAEANQAALDWIKKWPHWGDGIYSNVFCVYGETASGKTYLAKIWQNKSDARIIDENSILDKSYSNYSAYILEDIISLATHERELFCFIDHVITNKKFLLITSNTALSRLNFSLPDLRSRMNSFFSLEIKKPDEMMIQKILSKYFSDRQVMVNDKVINYLVTHIDRSYKNIACVVDKLDKASLLEHKKISIALVKSVLHKL